MSKPGAFRADLPALARTLLQHGPKKILATPRRVRVILHGRIIVDTTKAVHVWENAYYPQYYIPQGEFTSKFLKWKGNVESITVGDSDGVAAAQKILEVATGDGSDAHTDRVLSFNGGQLDGLIRLEFGSMDQWLEEDIPIYVHPKDPFKRIDILPSSRPIEVKVLGVTVAKSSYAVHLLETGLPTRYYLPLGSVEQSVLRKSDLTTKCPYKGEAEYYHVEVGGEVQENLVWYYRLPTHESAGVSGLVCFYNEKVDIILDGELLERPKTHFK